MDKNELITSLGGAIAVSLLASPLAQAVDKPGEGKCGDNMKEGGCSGSMPRSGEE